MAAFDKNVCALVVMHLFFFLTVLCELFHKSATVSLRSALFVTPRILLFTPNALSLNSTGGNENQHFVDGLALRGRALQVSFFFTDSEKERGRQMNDGSITLHIVNVKSLQGSINHLNP